MSYDKNNETGLEKTLLKCGLVMPISAIDTYPENHWKNVKDIIKESLEGLGFEISLVSDSNDSGVIQSRIVQNLFDSDIVVCDVSAKNPNVMFELGMRLAFDKPVVIIKDNSTDFSFDIAVIEHLEYPRDLHYNSILIFKENLKNKVIGTIESAKKTDYTTFLKHFSITKVAKIETKEVDSYEFLIKSISDIRDDIDMLDRKISRGISNNYTKNDAPDLSRLALLAANDFIETTGEIGNFKDFLSSDRAEDLKIHYHLDDELLKAAYNKATLERL